MLLIYLFSLFNGIFTEKQYDTKGKIPCMCVRSIIGYSMTLYQLLKFAGIEY